MFVDVFVVVFVVVCLCLWLLLWLCVWLWLCAVVEAWMVAVEVQHRTLGVGGRG